jgi:hypothetical protein
MPIDVAGYKECIPNLERAMNSTEETACVGKNRYKNYKIAKKVSIEMSEKYNTEIEPYPCPYCHRWHVGNVNKKHTKEHVNAQHICNNNG